MKTPHIVRRLLAQKRGPAPARLAIVCLTLAALLTCACSPLNDGGHARAGFAEASVAFGQGRYADALQQYERIIEQYPAARDRALFEMGITYSHPSNDQKDYRQALACFQALISDYPASGYRQDSEMMVFYISNVSIKDQSLAAQATRIETLEHELAGKAEEILSLRRQVAELEQRVFAFVLETGRADTILIEKNDRRLSLLAKGNVLKTYRIALGGNPVGPKERQGDGKTPEGRYVIDSINKGSQYHLALHLSYPNESDMKRARELGVAPGGDIMIHGIKNGFSWVGDAHAAVDWTKGCIAVTDEEIEEIFKLAPVGTAVEIRP